MINLFGRRVQIFILSITSVAYYVMNYLLSWPIFGGKFLGAKPDFLDLHQVIAQIDCIRSNQNPLIGYAESVEACNYSYSRFLFVVLSRLEPNRDYISLFGAIIGLLTLSMIVFVISSATDSVSERGQLAKWNLMALVVICSPPIMLLLERGNLDAVIFILVTSSFIAWKYERCLLAVFLVIAATLIKFYTLPLIVLYATWTQSKSKRYQILFVGLLTVAWLSYDWLSSEPSLPYPTEAAFGNSVLSMYLQTGQTNRLIDAAIGCFAVGLLVLILKRTTIGKRFLGRLSWCTNSSLSQRRQAVALNLVFVTCYFATSNYDYRLVFYALMGFIVLTSLHSSLIDKTIVSIVFIVSIWFSYNVGVMQVLGDFCIGIFGTVVVYFMWSERNQLFH